MIVVDSIARRSERAFFQLDSPTPKKRVSPLMTRRKHLRSPTMKGSQKLLLGVVLSLPILAQAAEPASCQTVNFSDVGWTDITATTATTSVVLQSLGYKTKTTMISVPVTYKSLADGKNMDVFLGNWMPTMENDIKAYRDAGSVEIVRTNLKGAKYPLAVPQALSAQ